MTDLPFRNPDLGVEERVEDLLARLTLEEKAGQVTQYFYFGTFGQDVADDGSAEARQ